MPFIIATSYRQLQSTAAVAFVSAGPDQQLICDTGSVLEATVIGDLTGKTIEWEQLSGSAVTFTSTVYALSVTFTQNDFDDKTFRFTVDKGLPTAKSDTITTFGTPTEQMFLTAPSINFDATQTPFVIYNQIAPASLSMLENNASITYSTTDLVWQVPTIPAGITHIGYSVESNVSGTFQSVATLSNTSQAYSVVPNNSLYRVVALVQRTGGASGRIISNVIYVNGTVSTTLTGVGAHVSDAFLTSTPSARYEVANPVIRSLVLISHNPDDEIVQSSNPSARYSISNTIIQQLSLTSCPTQQNDVYVSNPSAAHAIDNVVVADLTGGNVGG